MSFSSQHLSSQSFQPFSAQNPVRPLSSNSSEVSTSTAARPRRTNAVGRPRTVSDAYLERLKELVSHDPRQFGYPFRRWTARWLNQHLSQETGVSVSDRHINRLLKQMGLSTRTSYANASLSRRHNPNLHIQIGELSPEAQAALLAQKQPTSHPNPVSQPFVSEMDCG